MKVFYDNLGQLVTSEDRKIFYKDVEVIDGKIPNLELGQEHFVTDECGREYPIIHRGIVHTDWFSKTYDATEERLGSYVENDQTTFNVYAPTATKVFVSYHNKKHLMLRKPNGVYTHKVAKNLHNVSYSYVVHVNGDVHVTTDVYAKASLPNGVASVVVDFKQLNLNVVPLKPRKGVILETQVRDFSMDPNVPFKNRGKFLGLLESYGNYGKRHIEDMGVSHIQLMPVNDFGSVDEMNPFLNYNWGYDPMQYMVLEGSYSSDITNPVQVIQDFANVVDGYHQSGIGVNLDVVFNHIYEVFPSSLNKTVPYFYFRYNEGYYLLNGTYCGNEIASERPMVRKMIVDTCKYYAETFNIDGFRFDLMGIMDIETLNSIQRALPNLHIYGEGWHMQSGLSDQMKASIPNSRKMPNVGHFNEQFRDVIGGRTDGSGLGFADTGLTPNIQMSVLGSNNIFQSPFQSINYVECHDNYALADRVAILNRDINVIDSINALVILSKGVPFMQIGQSFFRDKQRNNNSYNLPDKINHIDWSYVDRYRDHHEWVKFCIQFRKENPEYRIDFDHASIRFVGSHQTLSIHPTWVDVNQHEGE